MITRYILCARRALRDADENDLSLLSVLEDINAQGFPLIVPRATLVWCVTREPTESADYTGTLRVTHEQKVLAETSLDIHFGDRMTNRLLMQMAGLPIPAPGKILFQATLSNGLQAEYSITVEPSPAGTSVPPGQVGGAYIAI